METGWHPNHPLSIGCRIGAYGSLVRCGWTASGDELMTKRMLSDRWKLSFSPWRTYRCTMQLILSMGAKHGLEIARRGRKLLLAVPAEVWVPLILSQSMHGDSYSLWCGNLRCHLEGVSWGREGRRALQWGASMPCAHLRAQSHSGATSKWLN